MGGESFGGDNQASQHGRRPSSVVAAVKHPAVTPYRHTPRAPLRAVVIDLEIAVFGVCDFLECARKLELKTKGLSASKGRTNQKSQTLSQ
jgi:hypothetical protein